MPLTPWFCKRAMVDELTRQGFAPDAFKLTARTISFADLARGDRIFVTIHGWQPDARWDALSAHAHALGFSVEAGGSS